MLLQVLHREHAAGLYSKMPFAVSLCCVEIPYNTVAAAIFSCVGPVLSARAVYERLTGLLITSYLFMCRSLILWCISLLKPVRTLFQFQSLVYQPLLRCLHQHRSPWQLQYMQASQ